MINDEYSIIPLLQTNLDCSIAGSDNLMRLVDGKYLTTDSSHMWTVRYEPQTQITITITFNTETYLMGMRFWNYNDSMDLSFCGVL